ncbi:MAG: LysM peptidoglycan-binding domain-containing protein [Firmicutes bacterium]|nr:LysM peptidoglycan-binding domain-containing protein [Bacillota bacterium]
MVNSDNNGGSCPGFIYTVVIGDTLYSIAKRYNISVQSIIESNPGIQAESLQIGQQICIPTQAPPQEPCPGRLYNIKAGDTFISIARQFGYTLDALLAINPGVDPNNLRVGQEICLPPSPGGGPFPCYGGSIYRIKAGDTLYSIARQYGVSLEQIINANPQLDPENLIIGDPVCIPR